MIITPNSDVFCFIHFEMLSSVTTQINLFIKKYLFLKAKIIWSEIVWGYFNVISSSSSVEWLKVLFTHCTVKTFRKWSFYQTVDTSKILEFVTWTSQRWKNFISGQGYVIIFLRLISFYGYYLFSFDFVSDQHHFTSKCSCTCTCITYI